jgi:hypothetical protein
MSRSGARKGTFSAGSIFISARVFSRSASCCSTAVSLPPNRWRPHSAIGCNGEFCRSCEQLHSVQVCGVSRRRVCSSSTRRDLPYPGSPTIRTNCPSPCRARSQRRISMAISSSRPTSGVIASSYLGWEFSRIGHQLSPGRWSGLFVGMAAWRNGVWARPFVIQN